MARSSTTFEKGNTAGFQPGNQLALKHGIFSRIQLAAKLPEARAHLEALLASNPIPPQRVDDVIRERYVELYAEFLNATEYLGRVGPLTEAGGVRDASRHRLQISDRLERMEREMGIGALHRAQTSQLQASANLSQAEVLAAEQRLAARRAQRLLEGPR